MNTGRFWFGPEAYIEAATALLRRSSDAECIAVCAARHSCDNGNFMAPHDGLGYWFEFDVDSPTMPWFRFKDQAFEPWPVDKGELSPETRERLQAARPAPTTEKQAWPPEKNNGRSRMMPPTDCPRCRSPLHLLSSGETLCYVCGLGERLLKFEWGKNPGSRHGFGKPLQIRPQP